MLKSTVIYDVTITLNDGQEMSCLLLSKPDALTLAAIAEAQSAKTELIEALAFAHDIAVPSLDDSELSDITEIIVAGTLLGKVTVSPVAAFVVTPKRGRKPKPIDAKVVDESSA